MLAFGIAFVPMGALAQGTSAPAPVVFAGAGSLRGAITAIARSYTAQTRVPVRLLFGSSGTLERKIESGAISPDIFASADMENPRKLADAGTSDGAVVRYARNALCAVARSGWTVTGQSEPVRTATLQSALIDPAERIGTSTPRDDPSGTYARDILRNAGAPVAVQAPQSTYGLPANARMLFGGYPLSPTVPPNTDPSVYFLTTPPPDWAVDVILTYCSTARAAVRQTSALELLELPPNLAQIAEYGYTVPRGAANASGGMSFGHYLLTPAAQSIFAAAGFLPP